MIFSLKKSQHSSFIPHRTVITFSKLSWMSFPHILRQTIPSTFMVMLKCQIYSSLGRKKGQQMLIGENPSEHIIFQWVHICTWSLALITFVSVVPQSMNASFNHLQTFTKRKTKIRCAPTHTWLYKLVVYGNGCYYKKTQNFHRLCKCCRDSHKSLTPQTAWFDYNSLFYEFRKTTSINDSWRLRVMKVFLFHVSFYKILQGYQMTAHSNILDCLALKDDIFLKMSMSLT